MTVKDLKNVLISRNPVQINLNTLLGTISKQYALITLVPDSLNGYNVDLMDIQRGVASSGYSLITLTINCTCVSNENIKFVLREI